LQPTIILLGQRSGSLSRDSRRGMSPVELCRAKAGSHFSAGISECYPFCFKSNFGGSMKKWAWILAVPVLISFATAQVSSSLNMPEEKSSQGTWKEADPGERMFFPHDMFWGWAQFDL